MTALDALEALKAVWNRVQAMAEARELHLWFNGPWPPEDPAEPGSKFFIEDVSGSDADSGETCPDVFGPATLEECERWLDTP